MNVGAKPKVETTKIDAQKSNAEAKKILEE